MKTVGSFVTSFVLSNFMILLLQLQGMDKYWKTAVIYDLFVAKWETGNRGKILGLSALNTFFIGFT